MDKSADSRSPRPLCQNIRESVACLSFVHTMHSYPFHSKQGLTVYCVGMPGPWYPILTDHYNLINKTEV